MKKKSKYSFSDILFSTAFIHNPVLIQAVGLGAVVAVATTLKTAVLLALAFAPVMIVTQVIASAILKKVPRWIRVTLYLIIGTIMIVPLIYLIDAYVPEIRLGAGIYLALTAINSITALHCEKVAVKTDVLSAFYDSCASSIGYGVVIILIGLIREILGLSTIWGIEIPMPIKFPGILMPFGGFIMLAFAAAALKAFINWKYPEQSAETEIQIKKTAVIVSKKKLEQEQAKQNAPQKSENENADNEAEIQNDEEEVQKIEAQESEEAQNEKEEEKQEEEIPKKEEIDIKENPEYDTSSMLKPLDDSEDISDDEGLFDELKFSNTKSIDTKIDSLFDKIMSEIDFNSADEEEKK